MEALKKSPFRIALTALGLVVFTPIIATPMLLSVIFVKPGKFVFYLMRLWSRIISALMGLKISVFGTENLEPGASYIITPNHQGIADIHAMASALPVYFRWVLKKELLRIPVFGWALWCTGPIAIDRSNTANSIETLNKEKDEKLKDGWSVLIYPEGTRTPDGNLKDFKKGAFMMAVQTGIAILPVVCNGAFKILPKKTIALRPGHVTLTICPPIPTQGLSEEDVPELMSKTRQALLSELRPDFDPFSD